MNNIARKEKLPRRRPFSVRTPLIAAVMRNEARYIVEWVAWHKLQGFDLMVSDNCRDGPQTELLHRLEDAGYLMYVDCRSLVSEAQLPAYRKMVWRAFRAGYRLIGFIDGDEFFEPVTGDGRRGSEVVTEVLGRRGVHAANFRWAIFGSHGQEKYRDEPVMARFTRRADWRYPANQWGKPFARIASLLLARPHFGIRRRHYFGIKGPHHVGIAKRRYMVDDLRGVRLLERDPYMEWKNARIRHYAVKSLEECRDKARRGDVLYVDNKYEQPAYREEYDRNDVPDPLGEADLDRLKAKIAEIRSRIGMPGEAMSGSSCARS